MELPTGAEIMRDTVETSIVPGVQAFSAEANAMLSDAEAFCGAPTAEGLGQLQTRWLSLSEAWNGIAAYNFGPLDDDVIVPKIIFVESMRQRGTDYTQTVRDGIVRGLGSDETLDVAYFDRQTFDEVGMLALEVLVFEDSREGNSTDPADVLADYVGSPRKCDFLRGVAGLLAADAAEVEFGWTTEFDGSAEPFAETMTKPTLDDGSEPVVALLIALQQHVDYIKVRKLEGILDARLSGHFYPNVLATLDSMETLLAQPSEDSFGLLERMEATGNTAEVELVSDNFAAARAAAMAQERETLAAALGRLDGNLKREIPDALGVDLGLTFTDGD
ncbi:MAG: imelysin family protein [Nannocystaceae bacterium]|nr:hypothetical protein [bacterium]